MNARVNAVAIMGATATGKSRVSIHLAKMFGGEIISMDSRQVYRGLDIGTAKVTPAEQAQARHHLIDTLDPTEPNSAGKHIGAALELITTLERSGKLPFVVGGTGLYFRALFHGLIDIEIPEDELATIRAGLAEASTPELARSLREIDAERAESLSANDRVRLLRALEIYHYSGKTYSQHVAEQKTREWRGLKIVLTFPREQLRQRIDQRTREMFDRGWVDEVRELLASGLTADAPAMGSLGYGLIARRIVDGGDPNAVDEVITLTQQYAKRQETFFRSEGDAHWVDMSQADSLQRVEALVTAHGSL